MTGPVSTALEADLRTWIRRQGVVLWLDLDDHYSGFVDSLVETEDLPYRVHAFRGSHLALMLALEDAAGGLDKPRLVVHLPGFNEEQVRGTPLFELYAAGVRYRKKLDTLVTEAAAGRVRPEQIEAFKGRGELSLQAADAWLADLLDEPGGGLASQLQAMSLRAVVDDLLGGGFVAKRARNPEDQEALWSQLSTWTGLPDAWRDEALPSTRPRPSDIAFAASSWALAVEYVDDLKRPPVDARLAAAPGLPRLVIDGCRELCGHLRDRHATFYKRTADEAEGWLADEVEAARAEDLGRIDTFRFEEDRVLEAALVALEDERWDQGLEWAQARDGDRSFWLRQDASRRATWQLIADAARLGRALTRAGPSLEAVSLTEALDRYSEAGAAVDQAHRHLEQRRTALLYTQLPEFETLRARLDGLRESWRWWADEWAREFNQLCRREGFLPDESLQQRSLFDQVVRPFTQQAGVTAYFMVDALRFEMGEELYRTLVDTPATTAHLRGRFAELPTVTEVGMNVLAPVCDGGRLHTAVTGNRFKGFSTGEFRVTSPDTRQRAMHDRVGGATCPWLTLAEVLDRDTTSLKQALARARLLVVHSKEIDAAGENGVGTAVFDTVMQKLRAAWHLLREAGVRRFVITSDHGFLLLDETARNVVSHGRKIDPKRRHVISPVAADHTGESRVPLADLRYEGAEGHVMFPESTAVFDLGKRSMSFVHGGNSLQERVIPVLTVVHRNASGRDTLRYLLHAELREGVGGMHCFSARLEMAAQATLAFGGTREVELGLRVVEDDSVHVELCQTRGGARLDAGSVYAKESQPFELFFKLTGQREARVRVELHHPGGVADVEPCVVDGRFGVVGLGGSEPAGPAAPGTTDSGWLTDLPTSGVRQVFEHLAVHGAVTESEVATMLGGARKVRRFSLHFEEYAASAPFEVRIDVIGGVKRYVREGSG